MRENNPNDSSVFRGNSITSWLLKSNKACFLFFRYEDYPKIFRKKQHE